MFEEAVLEEKVTPSNATKPVALMTAEEKRRFALDRFEAIKDEVKKAIVDRFSNLNVEIDGLGVVNGTAIQCTIRHNISQRTYNCLVSPINAETGLLDEMASTEVIANGICSFVHRTSIGWIHGPKNKAKSQPTPNNSTPKMTKSEKRRLKALQQEEEARKIRERKEAVKKLYIALMPYLNKKSKIFQFDNNGIFCIDGRKTAKNILEYMDKEFEKNGVPVCEIDAAAANTAQLKGLAGKTYDDYIGSLGKSAKIQFLPIVSGPGVAEIKKVHDDFGNAKKSANNLLYYLPKKSESPTISAWCKLDNPGDLILETSLCTATIRKNKIKEFKIKEAVKACLDAVGSAKYKEASRYILQQIKDFPYQIAYSSGDGLLSKSGVVNVIVQEPKYNARISTTLTCKYSTGESWRQYFKNTLKDVEKRMNEEFSKKKAEEEKKFAPFKGSLLPAEIVAIVHANGYITERNVINTLRGTSTSFYVKSHKHDNRGAFNDISEEAFGDLISRMCKAGILYTVEINGKHCYYDALKTKYENIDKLMEYETKKLSVVKKLVKEGKALNYYDALQYFESFDGTELDVKDYMHLLHLAKSVEFCCLHGESYIQTFTNAPNEFKQYVKMLRENEEDRRIKRLYKAIVEAVKK